MVKTLVKRKFRKMLYSVILSIIPWLFLFICILSIFSLFQKQPSESSVQAETLGALCRGGTAVIDQNMKRYERAVQSEAKVQGMGEYTQILLAIAQHESLGGTLSQDIFQSSESLGLSPNTLDTERSIKAGVSALKGRISEGEKYGITDCKAILQAYNQGPAFLVYMHNHKQTTWSPEVVQGYMATRPGNNNGTSDYPNRVLKYIRTAASSSGGVALTGDKAKALYAEASKHLGKPYNFGAPSGIGKENPPNFDCSSFSQYVYWKVLNVSIPRTANTQWNSSMFQHITASEAKPGDLVFFEGTYNTNGKSHVGIYFGNGMMINSQTAGVTLESVSNWTEFNPTYARLK